MSIGCIRSTSAGTEFAIALIESLKANNLVRTPEGVAVWLEVKSCYPNAVLPKDVWKHRDPLCKDEATSLAEVMKDARVKRQPESGELIAPQAAGTWSQQLHFSWDVALRELYIPADPDAKASTKRMTFAMFWTNVVDSKLSPHLVDEKQKLIIAESLFVSSGSPERKLWGFLLLAKVMATAPLQFLQSTFTTNTVLLLANHLKLNERYLHKSAKKAVQALQTRAVREPRIVSLAMEGFVLGPSGLHNFDNMTRTKTIAELMTAADLATYRDLVAAFRNAMERPQVNDGKQADAKRSAFADILVSVCSQALAMATEVKREPLSVADGALDVLIAFAYAEKSLGSDGRTFEPPPSRDCRLYLRSRVRTCLDQSLQNRVTQFHLLRHSIGTLKSIQKQADPDHAIVEFDTETQAIVDVAWKSLGKISKTVSLAHY